MTQRTLDVYLVVHLAHDGPALDEADVIEMLTSEVEAMGGIWVENNEGEEIEVSIVSVGLAPEAQNADS